MNLFCYIPQDHDATSFYRALQPLSQLRKLMPDLHLYFAGETVKMRDVAPMDACFIQRPCNKDHAALVRLCRSVGVKVWLDYDDNLLCVPETNPAYAQYSSQETKLALLELLKSADVVSVSTQALARDLLPYVSDGVKIKVIPNALNDYLLKAKPEFSPHKLVSWRGTQSHQSDLHSFAPQILSVACSNPSWLFHFMGYNPFYLTGPLGKQGKHTGPTEILNYHEVLKRAQPNVAIVTLSDSPFNRCKSNIAWIEATYAGAVTLAPNWEEWQKPGAITYSSMREFEDMLDRLIHLPSADLAKYHALSWQYIDEHLKLSRVNHSREKLLRELTGGTV